MVTRLVGAATLVVVAGWMLSVAHAASADEIQHLLDYVGASGCTFVRNGVESDAAAALKHVRRKYAYAKSHVSSAEDFIRLVASRSSTSGEPYFVRCGNSRLPSEEWLRGELLRYREKTTQ